MSSNPLNTIRSDAENTPTNFLKLPSEIRNTIYELCLLQSEPLDPWFEQGLTPGLLRANKAIHHEASFLLYSRNSFDFTMAAPDVIALFLETIGYNNAACIQHVHINFPEFCDLEPGNITIKEGSMSIFTYIQKRCTNLATLKTSISSTDAMEIKLDEPDNVKVATDALILVNTHFRAIPSLRNIIVEVYEDGLSDYIRREMENHGWTLSLVEYVDHWDGWEPGRTPSDDEDDWEGYGDDSYNIDDDNDDFEYDSDFWRRAAD